MKESKFVEFKEKITNTFLKTVSAYANYGTGVIIFGIADDGTVKGIENVDKSCLDIENMINDNIDPIPEFSLETKENTITLIVKEGKHKPYFCKSKTYRRGFTSTVEADRFEISRLIMEGMNIEYDEMPSKKQDLKFEVLSAKLKEALKLSDVTTDTMKTLELFKEEEGYNVAAELLADKNNMPGIDIARYGDTKNIVRDRETCAGESVLLQLEQAVNMYRKYYQYDEINGMHRITVSMIPEEAFREAIANALVHRRWDVDVCVNVAMFPDRIEITSAGGLPNGMSEETFLRGGISILRNRILGNVFMRLGLTEHLGSGINNINEAYKESRRKPIFEARDESVRVTLPVVTFDDDLTLDEKHVLKLLENRCLASSDVVKATGFGKSKAVLILSKLVSEGYARMVGNGRGTKYQA